VVHHVNLNWNQIMAFLTDMALLQEGQAEQSSTEAVPF
jgi:hypothetical protein